jgi:hypothetical protein
MGGGYKEIASSMGDDFPSALAGGAMGGAMGGLGSSMGGEFGLDQGPTNIDRQRPITDEVPF